MKSTTAWLKMTIPVKRPFCPKRCTAEDFKGVSHRARLYHGLRGTYCRVCGTFYEAVTSEDGLRVRYVELTEDGL